MNVVGIYLNCNVYQIIFYTVLHIKQSFVSDENKYFRDYNLCMCTSVNMHDTCWLTQGIIMVKIYIIKKYACIYFHMQDGGQNMVCIEVVKMKCT